MAETVKITIDGKMYDLPVVAGVEAEKALDISAFRQKTGYVTLDAGFANTASCKSAITFLDGEKGVLRYRGIPIEELAEKSSFVETAFLLIYGHLPSKDELERFSQGFSDNAMIHESFKHFFDGYPAGGHPMGLLSSMVGSLAAFYPELIKPSPSKTEIDTIVVELLSKIRTIAAFAYKKSIGEPYVYPRYDLKYIQNFLNMMFSSPARHYEIRPEMVDALQCLFILHADHEQNCSTSTVRMVGSSQANLFACISAGINALWGPLHGGANQAVVEMLDVIHKEGCDVKKYVEKAKSREDTFRLMGFGHRVYKNYDPRAKIIKKKVDALLNALKIKDPLLDIAKELEEIALKDDYFIEKKLFPNVDFYSGIAYKAIGIPINMFPVMFAIGRLPGWIAHWKEMVEDPTTRIGRPRQIYTGEIKRSYIPMDKR